MSTTATPSTSSKELSLVENLKFTDFALGLDFTGLNDVLARTTSRGDSGPSIAWTIGHLAHFWIQMLALLGKQRLDPFEERFSNAAAKGPGSPHGEKSVLQSLAFFVWHEAYHMGQIGALRVRLDLTPTATLAREARAAAKPV